MPKIASCSVITAGGLRFDDTVVYTYIFSLFLTLSFSFAGALKETRMCEVVTVLACDVDTCVARHPSGVPDKIRVLILFLGCFSHGSAKGEE